MWPVGSSRSRLHKHADIVRAPDVGCIVRSRTPLRPYARLTMLMPHVDAYMQQLVLVVDQVHIEEIGCRSDMSWVVIRTVRTKCA